jgi:tRNA-dihydrouridine synthase B
MLKFNDFERPIGIQIFGNDPNIVSKSAEYIVDNYNPDIIDINFGCPVPKITKRGAGSAALKDLNIMKELATKVVKAVPKTPVTVKMRSGWDKENIIISEAGKILEDSGIKAITLHARTSKQLYKGKADWSLIAKLKNSVNIPIIGNGDVLSVEDYYNMKNTTGCDAIMIGRGALGKPWIFRDIINSLSGRKIIDISLNEIISICQKHIKLLEKYKSNIACVNLSKKHINYYLKNFKNSSLHRREIMLCSNIEDIKKILKSI